jgi:hypothetical protein
MNSLSDRASWKAARIVAAREQSILNDTLRGMGPQFNVGWDLDIPEQIDDIRAEFSRDNDTWRYYVAENYADFIAMSKLLAQSHVETWEEPSGESETLPVSERFADTTFYAHRLMGAGGGAIRATGIALVGDLSAPNRAVQQVSVEISGNAAAILKKSFSRKRVYVSGAGGVEVTDPNDYERRSIEANGILTKVAHGIGACGVNLYMGKETERQSHELSIVLDQGFVVVGEQPDPTYGEIAVVRLAI